MSENFPAFSQNLFVGIVKNAFHLSIGTFWGQKIRKKIMTFYSFLDSELKKSGLSSNVLSKDRQNSNLPVQGEEGFLSVKENLNRFRTFSQNLSAICPKVCGEVVKTEISISRGSCQGKTYCSQEVRHFLSNSYFEWNISTLLPRNFCRFCQKTAFS